MNARQGERGGRPKRRTKLSAGNIAFIVAVYAGLALVGAVSVYFYLRPSAFRHAPPPLASSAKTARPSELMAVDAGGGRYTVYRRDPQTGKDQAVGVFDADEISAMGLVPPGWHPAAGKRNSRIESLQTELTGRAAADGQH